MNTAKFYNKLIELENYYKNNDFLNYNDLFSELKKEIYNETLKQTTSPTRKKAISKVQSIAKKIAKRNTKPVLQYSSKLSTYNGVQGYYYTDSYFLTFTRDNMTEIIPDIWKYPEVERLLNINDDFIININELDYKNICLNAKLKDKNNQIFPLTLYDKNTLEPAYKVYFSANYLKIAYELLEINKNSNDLEFISAGPRKPAKLTNKKTGELILILPIIKYE